MLFSQAFYSLEIYKYFYLFPHFYHQTSGLIVHNCALTAAPAIQIVLLSQMFQQPPHSPNLCPPLSWCSTIADFFLLETLLFPPGPLWASISQVLWSFLTFLFVSQSYIFPLAHSEQVFLMIHFPTLFSFCRLFLCHHIPTTSTILSEWFQSPSLKLKLQLVFLIASWTSLPEFPTVTCYSCPNYTYPLS